MESLGGGQSVGEIQQEVGNWESCRSHRQALFAAIISRLLIVQFSILNFQGLKCGLGEA